MLFLRFKGCYTSRYTLSLITHFPREHNCSCLQVKRCQTTIFTLLTISAIYYPLRPKVIKFNDLYSCKLLDLEHFYGKLNNSFCNRSRGLIYIKLIISNGNDVLLLHILVIVTSGRFIEFRLFKATYSSYLQLFMPRILITTLLYALGNTLLIIFGKNVTFSTNAFHKIGIINTNNQL